MNQQYPVIVKHHAPRLGEKHYLILNHVLLLILVILSGYILFIPFLPEFYEIYNKAFDRTKGYKYKSRLASSEIQSKKIDTQSLKKVPNDGDFMVIPKIGVDTPITEGIGPEALSKGVWRRPQSSTPDAGGNTVITGHRFLYASGPKTFYHLDKMSLGDRFFIFWDGKEYDYEVEEIFTVTPDRVDIEDNTDRSIVTLYTCTPLWSATHRLVVRAKLISGPDI